VIARKRVKKAHQKMEKNCNQKRKPWKAVPTQRKVERVNRTRHWMKHSPRKRQLKQGWRTLKEKMKPKKLKKKLMIKAHPRATKPTILVLQRQKR